MSVNMNIAPVTAKDQSASVLGSANTKFFLVFAKSTNLSHPLKIITKTTSKRVYSTNKTQGTILKG